MTKEQARSAVARASTRARGKDNGAVVQAGTICAKGVEVIGKSSPATPRRADPTWPR
jgi:hypothetical protein